MRKEYLHFYFFWDTSLLRDFLHIPNSPFPLLTFLFLYLLRHPLKLSQKTRCTILMDLGQEGCLPLTFALFANGAAKQLRPCPAAGRLVTETNVDRGTVYKCKQKPHGRWNLIL